MDNFRLPDLTAVGQQPLMFGPTGSYPQPSTLKRQQTYPQTAFNVPVYNSIEDWSAAELTTDSAQSPASGSPISPVFNGTGSFSFSNSASGDDWAAWDKLEQSPESDFFLKSELLDSPDLSSIPIMSPDLNSMEVSNPALDDVVFGREGVNDTRPLFQSPQINLTMQGQARSAPASAPTAKSPAQSSNRGLPTPPGASSQARRYPVRNSLKRKSSDCSESSTPSSPRSSCSPPPPQRRHTAPSKDASEASISSSKTPSLGPKKTAHNMIEKRYRTNLNDKIAALRDSVPALRVMVHRLEHADTTTGSDACGSLDIMDEIKAEAGLGGGLDPDEDLGGLAPAHKLNKATILSKATEYIAHLERKNRSLAKENSALRNRVEGFEMLVMSRGGQRGMWN